MGKFRTLWVHTLIPAKATCPRYEGKPGLRFTLPLLNFYKSWL